MPIDRRRFLQLAAATSFGAKLRAQALPTHRPDALQSPLYSEVAITGGIARQQQANAQAILATFDDDALLKPFRAMAGADAPGRNLGGWYEYLPTYDWHHGDAGLAPGHCFGQWTSAMARFAASQEDASARERVLRLYRLLAETISPRFFDLTRFPAYTLDKLNCGLLDAHALLNSPEALAIANKVRDCALPSLPGAAIERDGHTAWRADRDQSWHWDESYTLPENLYLLYQAGAGSAYATMARAYLLNTFFQPLAQGRNVLGGLHGYSHVNALCSAMQAYLVEGDERYRQAATNGLDMVAAQSYATGGWAPDEVFEVPGSGRLLASLTSTHNSFETPCGTYAFLKICRYLLSLTRDGRYGDLMERVLYNSMFGALPLQPDGHTFYYADLNLQARRVYSDHRWPCCAGTYTQVAADYGINSYLLDGESGRDVWVNLYLPSTLRFNVDGAAAQLAQTGDYPLGPMVHLDLTLDRPSVFALHLRIPAWCSSPRLRVNGQSQPVRPLNGFAAIRRQWRNGDRIVLELPAQPRLDPFPADGGKPPAMAALCCGALVLLPDRVASLRSTDLPTQQRAAPTEWRTVDGQLRFRPFFAIGNDSYSTYVHLA